MWPSIIRCSKCLLRHITRNNKPSRSKDVNLEFTGSHLGYHFGLQPNSTNTSPVLSIHIRNNVWWFLRNFQEGSLSIQQLQARQSLDKLSGLSLEVAELLLNLGSDRCWYLKKEGFYQFNEKQQYSVLILKRNIQVKIKQKVNHI